ncbi:DUF6344 domain-containing protein [Streptomyces phyllanthi]|uniref:DUF6344 domain-containing protein n=1 Tax=Streptomyces phyllanthi TaxID=1803180 RepID=UPI00336CFADA
MARNKVRNLWTAVVTAFIALCTALGLITPTASAAVPHTAPACNSAQKTADAPALPHWSRPYGRSLPPTMKQRIRAEAHGSSPSCRLRPSGEPLTGPLSEPHGTQFINDMTADTTTAHRAGPRT